MSSLPSTGCEWPVFDLSYRSVRRFRGGRDPSLQLLSVLHKNCTLKSSESKSCLSKLLYFVHSVIKEFAVQVLSVRFESNLKWCARNLWINKTRAWRSPLTLGHNSRRAQPSAHLPAGHQALCWLSAGLPCWDEAETAELDIWPAVTRGRRRMSWLTATSRRAKQWYRWEKTWKWLKLQYWSGKREGLTLLLPWGQNVPQGLGFKIEFLWAVLTQGQQEG